MHQTLTQMLDSFIYPRWHDDALCRHPNYDEDWWFPNSKKAEKLAILVCNECPVKEKCLNWIRDIEKQDQKPSPGIYGGLTEDQRRYTKTCILKACDVVLPSPFHDFCSDDHRKKHARYYAKIPLKVRKYGQ